MNVKRLLLGIIFLLPICFCIGVRVQRSIVFEIECGGHLKRAADANTVSLAIQEMEIVVAYLEEEGMTNGYTSILYCTPDEDVRFWYTNIKDALKELRAVTPEATQLERSNLLIKLRETLIINTNKGERITCPKGISIYPWNRVICSLFIISIATAIFGVVFIASSRDQNYYYLRP